jgi:adenylate cyclase
MTFFAARATADPVLSVRRALKRVEEGDLDVEVPVYDGSELGLLQAGFNRMVEGLRERERVRDLFGRHVGEDVAREALERGVEMGGEVRDVAVLFIDVVGSTTLAATRPPTEVVDLLNRFFAVVVDVVDEHGGFINKFEGDAALAVFGAPVVRGNPAAQALAAAREIVRRLRDEVPELDAGIGLSAGPAVAGNIGGAQRFEYTVIGDPVNEAARLTELAKDTPARVLASADIVERAGAHEATHWELGDPVTLRGRTHQTRLASPVAVAA